RGTRPREDADRSGLQTLKQFSAMALPVMLAVVATGLIVADRMVGTSYAALAATSYGWFLDAKLALLAVILVIAARARLVWLPALSQRAAGATAGGGGLRQSVTVEVGLAAALALAVALPPLAVPAYPETYRKTPVPFDAISVANGVTLFAANCVACHGPQAKGNGMRAKEFPKPPVDLLTEPHTALHTAGDFFHWL